MFLTTTSKSIVPYWPDHVLGPYLKKQLSWWVCLGQFQVRYWLHQNQFKFLSMISLEPRFHIFPLPTFLNLPQTKHYAKAEVSGVDSAACFQSVAPPVLPPLFAFQFIFNGPDTLVYNNKYQAQGYNETVSSCCFSLITLLQKRRKEKRKYRTNASKSGETWWRLSPTAEKCEFGIAAVKTWFEIANISLLWLSASFGRKTPLCILPDSSFHVRAFFVCLEDPTWPKTNKKQGGRPKT